MLLLLATSVWCWTIIAMSGFALWRFRADLMRMEQPPAPDAPAPVAAVPAKPEAEEAAQAKAGALGVAAAYIRNQFWPAAVKRWSSFCSALAAGEDHAAVLKESGYKSAEQQLWGETPTEKYRRVREGMEASAAQLVSSRAGRISDLALIANIAPFIGLFGTVWGIIGSFAAIAGANDTSLSTVAPGIAEALAATAYGLAVAIPASIAYNQLGVAFSGTALRLKRRVPQWAIEVVSVGRKP